MTHGVKEGRTARYNDKICSARHSRHSRPHNYNIFVFAGSKADDVVGRTDRLTVRQRGAPENSTCWPVITAGACNKNINQNYKQQKVVHTVISAVGRGSSFD